MDENKSVIVLLLADRRVPIKLIHEYVYILDQSGIDTGLKFSLASRGVKSKHLNSIVEELESEGLIEYSGNLLVLSELGDIKLDDFVVPISLVDKIDCLVDTLSYLTYSEIVLTGITAFVVRDYIKREGVLKLKDKREYFKKTIEAFRFTEYSDETFNLVFKTLNSVR